MCEQCKDCEAKLNEERRMVEVLREKNNELEAVNRNQKEMIENLLNRLDRRREPIYPPSPPERPWRPKPEEWDSLL